MSIFDYILAVLPGLPVSLSLTFTALITAFLLSVLFTLVLSLKPRVLTPLVKGISPVYQDAAAGPVFPDLFRARAV